MLSVEKEVAQGLPDGKVQERVCHVETRQAWDLPVGNKWVLPVENKLEGEEVSAFASST